MVKKSARVCGGSSFTTPLSTAITDPCIVIPEVAAAAAGKDLMWYSILYVPCVGVGEKKRGFCTPNRRGEQLAVLA